MYTCVQNITPKVVLRPVVLHQLNNFDIAGVTTLPEFTG